MPVDTSFRRTFGTDLSNLPRSKTLFVKKGSLTGDGTHGSPSSASSAPGFAATSSSSSQISPVSPQGVYQQLLDSSSPVSQSPGSIRRRSKFPASSSPRNLEGSWRVREDSSASSSQQEIGALDVVALSPKSAEDFRQFVEQIDASTAPQADSAVVNAPEAIPDNSQAQTSFRYTRQFLLSLRDSSREVPRNIIPEIFRPQSTVNSPLRRIFDQIPNPPETTSPFSPFQSSFSSPRLHLQPKQQTFHHTPSPSNKLLFQLPKPDFNALETAKSSSTASPALTSQRKAPAVAKARETDPARLAARQKQIDIGKNTEGYQNYLELVPKEARSKNDPRTPNKNQICSKRSWDGQVRKWRRQLHFYDPPELQAEDAAQLDHYESSFESINTPIFYLAISQAS